MTYRVTNNNLPVIMKILFDINKAVFLESNQNFAKKCNIFKKLSKLQIQHFVYHKTYHIGRQFYSEYQILQHMKHLENLRGYHSSNFKFTKKH